MVSFQGCPNWQWSMIPWSSHGAAAGVEFHLLDFWRAKGVCSAAEVCLMAAFNGVGEVMGRWVGGGGDDAGGATRWFSVRCISVMPALVVRGGARTSVRDDGRGVGWG